MMSFLSRISRFSLSALLLSLFVSLDTANGFSSFVTHSPRRLLQNHGYSSFSLATRTHSSVSHVSRSSLSMHMGHSHSHDHVHSSSSSNGVAANTKPVNAGRRRIALFIFSAMAILGPPLFKRHTLSQSDIVAFALTSTSLALVETTIRREIKHALMRIRQLGDGIRKHSTPLSAKYFFQNDNAADRVTLLGGVINLVLSVGKFGVGVACHSSALVADAGHSLSDLFSDFITLWVSERVSCGDCRNVCITLVRSIHAMLTLISLSVLLLFTGCPNWPIASRRRSSLWPCQV